MDFRSELERRTAEVNRIISGYLPEEEGRSAGLAKAMNYSMTAGGKRIRPILLLESCLLFGGDPAVCGPFMAALEMIHTHSLIHDDLPALDNDDYRRGRKTTHIVFGEAQAVLAGDALLNYAYETALKAFDCNADTGRTARALRILAEKTGIRGMLGGQSADVENEKNGNTALSREELDYIYLHKTAALLEAPLMIGAVLAGADERAVADMETAGRLTGLAFQIRDDILDVTSTDEELGKPVFSDARNEKTTYVTLFGTEEAERYVKELSTRAVSLLESYPGDTGFLREFILYMAERKK